MRWNRVNCRQIVNKYEIIGNRATQHELPCLFLVKKKLNIFDKYENVTENNSTQFVNKSNG